MNKDVSRWGSYVNSIEKTVQMGEVKFNSMNFLKKRKSHYFVQSPFAAIKISLNQLLQVRWCSDGVQQSIGHTTDS